MRRQLLTATLLAGSLVWAAPAPTGVQAEPARAVTGKELPPPEVAERPDNPVASVDSAGGAPATVQPSVIEAALTEQLRRTQGNQRTTVEVITTTADATTQLAAIGASPISSVGGITLVSLTATQIRQLADTTGVAQVRTPVDLRRALLSAPQPERGVVPSENIWDNWGSRGNGTGVKVGIIDIFDPSVLATQIAQDDINNVPAAQRKCFWLGAECPFGAPGYTHGNSVAEVISEGAPGAMLYLAEAGTLNDYLLAIDWFAANGVTILNHSAGGPFDGPGDGTGPSAAVVDYAVSKGIAWFNAAGNANKDPDYVKYAGGYWRGNWYDPTGNRWMNFYGSDESLSVFCGALMGVRWSDWGALRTDYDLYVSDYNGTTKTNGVKVLASANNQAAGASPLEGNDMRWLCNDTPADGPVYDTNHDGYVSLWVYRTTRNVAPPTGDVIEVMVNHGWLEYATSAGSAAIPFGDSKNPGAASVGSMYANGLSMYYYSARGPTNDGRVKPDISALGCLTTSIDGSGGECRDSGFGGTSAAAPVAAALGAVGKSALALATPAQVVAWLRSISIERMGQPVKNNIEGWGMPDLAEYPATQRAAAGFVSVTPLRYLDTRGVNGQAVGAPIGLRPPDSITTIYTGQPQGTPIAFNLAIVAATTAGYLQVYPTGYAAPGATSNVNVTAAGQTRANFAVVTAGVSGAVSFYSSGGGHIIADFVGAFIDGGRQFVSVTPYRAYDTHDCGACSGAPIAAGTFLDIDLAGTHASFDPQVGIPAMNTADAPVAVAVSVTVSEPVGGRGNLAVIRPGTTAVGTSNINFDVGETLSATTFIPVSAATGGKARIYVSRTAHVRIDILGYFAGADHGQQGYFTSMQPRRLLDTRGAAMPAAGSFVDAPLTGQFGVPLDGAGAVFVNTTSAGATGLGYVATGATAADGNFRTTSIPVAGFAVAAGSVATISDNGSLRLATTAPTHLIADLAGWFTGPEHPLAAPAVTAVFENPPPFAQINQLALSDDGGTVAYRATGFPAGPVYVWHRATGVTADTGVVASDIALSGDGTTLAFTTTAALVAGDTNGIADVYSYSVADALVQLVSSGNLYPYVDLEGISDDGNLVAFRTSTALAGADGDELIDLYLRNRALGDSTLASAAIPAGYSVDTGVLNGPGTFAVFTASNFGPLTTVRYNVTSSVSTSIGSWPGSLRDVSDNGTKVLFAGSKTVTLLDTATGVMTPLATTPFESPDLLADMRPSFDGAGDSLAVARRYSDFLGLPWIAIDKVDAVVIDLATGRPHNTSRTWNGGPPNGAVTDVVISDDGHWLAYATGATNTTPTAVSGPCIYLVDLTAV
ncbi:MAG: S8 family serine peptidase [Actinomycetota bacterium]|nr:S8 family serine peptidase [Actinomycetota bacterium]